MSGAYPFFSKKKYSISEFHSDEINHKVYISLIRHVYLQTFIAMCAATFCAVIIFAGLYSYTQSNLTLYSWITIFFAITFFRLGGVYFFKRHQFQDFKINFWRDLYILGAILGGISWGLAAILLFPTATLQQQILIILMLAGVTAGAVPLASGIPEAAVAFLVFTLIPFIVSVARYSVYFDWFFITAMGLYLIYTIILVIKAHEITSNTIKLSFENYQLLKELSNAKVELEMSNKKLEFAATHDALTHVANRDLFNIQLEDAMLTAKQQQKIVALLYIDLDFFKRVNDKYGHQMGDHVLILIIERLKNFLHSNGKIARLGGDELTIILDNIEKVSEAKSIANDLCELIAVPIMINGTELQLSASIGISIYPYEGTEVDTLLWSADQSMYYVKQHGGNNFHAKPPVNA